MVTNLHLKRRFLIFTLFIDLPSIIATQKPNTPISTQVTQSEITYEKPKNSFMHANIPNTISKKQPSTIKSIIHFIDNL